QLERHGGATFQAAAHAAVGRDVGVGQVAVDVAAGVVGHVVVADVPLLVARRQRLVAVQDRVPVGGRQLADEVGVGDRAAEEQAVQRQAGVVGQALGGGLELV